MSYSLSTEFAASSLEDAITKVKAAFTNNGFGLPPGTTDLSFHQVFASKGIDEGFTPTHVLGFCNPKLAHEALGAEPNIAVFLPCSVVVREKVASEQYECVSMNPALMSQVVGDNQAMVETASKAQVMLQAALDAIE